MSAERPHHEPDNSLEQARINQAGRLGLPPDASVEEVNKAVNKELYRKYGLPDNPTTDEIETVIQELRTKTAAELKGIEEGYEKRREGRRKEYARIYKLPEDASWEDIEKVKAEDYSELQKSVAVKLGLSADATREQVLAAIMEEKRVRFGLPEGATPEEIKKADLGFREKRLAELNQKLNESETTKRDG